VKGKVEQQREKMGREKGLEKGEDKRRGGGGLKLGKIDGARRKCERIKLETFCKETRSSLNGVYRVSLCLSPPSARFAPTHSHVCPAPTLHTPPTECHTWTRGSGVPRLKNPGLKPRMFFH